MGFIDEKFLAAISFLIFAFLIRNAFKRNIIGALDDRIAKIKSNLLEAETLKIDAKALLDKQTILKDQIDHEIDSILKHAHNQIEIMKENSKKDINELIAVKERILENKIQNQKRELQESILQEVVDKAILLASEKIANKKLSILDVNDIKESDLQKILPR